MANLTGVQSINLANNQYHSVADLPTVPSMSDLLLNGNMLSLHFSSNASSPSPSSSCPFIGSAPNLLALHLSRTNSDGHLADTFECLHRVFPSLVSLDLSTNTFTLPALSATTRCPGSITWPSYLPLLRELDLSNNVLSSWRMILMLRVPHSAPRVFCLFAWSPLSMLRLDVRGNLDM